MKNNSTFQYLNTNNFVASKKMGQNFLINNDIKNKIVKKADLHPNDLVIEIGPGLGAISEIILKTNYLIAIELDKRLADHLSQTFINDKKFHIINCDFLQFDLNSIIANNPFNKKFDRVIVIANLPYSISSLIIAKLIKLKSINYAIIMVQKEMALRLCAKLNSKNYNAFSIWTQQFADLEFLFDVGPNNFVPKPKVQSSVVKINFLNRNDDCNFYKEFKTFLNNAFSQKRKTIFNNLKQFYPIDKISLILNELNIDFNQRPQTITKDQYIKMLSKMKD